MTSELLRWHAVFWWIQCRRACLYLLADVDDTGTHSGVRTHDPEWYAMHPRKKHCPELGPSWARARRPALRKSSPRPRAIGSVSVFPPEVRTTFPHSRLMGYVSSYCKAPFRNGLNLPTLGLYHAAGLGSPRTRHPHGRQVFRETRELGD